MPHLTSSQFIIFRRILTSDIPLCLEFLEEFFKCLCLLYSKIFLSLKVALNSFVCVVRDCFLKLNPSPWKCRGYGSLNSNELKSCDIAGKCRLVWSWKVIKICCSLSFVLFPGRPKTRKRHENAAKENDEFCQQVADHSITGKRAVRTSQIFDMFYFRKYSFS